MCVDLELRARHRRDLDTTGWTTVHVARFVQPTYQPAMLSTRWCRQHGVTYPRCFRFSELQIINPEAVAVSILYAHLYGHHARPFSNERIEVTCHAAQGPVFCAFPPPSTSAKLAGGATIYITAFT